MVFGPEELGGAATSAVSDGQSPHSDGSTATQALRTFVDVCRGGSGGGGSNASVAGGGGGGGDAAGVFVGAGLEVGLAVVELIDAMHRSAASGQPVQHEIARPRPS